MQVIKNIIFLIYVLQALYYVIPRVQEFSGEDTIIGKTTPVYQAEESGSSARYTRHDHGICLRYSETGTVDQVSLIRRCVCHIKDLKIDFLFYFTVGLSIIKSHFSIKISILLVHHV